MDSVHGAEAGSEFHVAVRGNVDPAKPELIADGGSFRDRTARVFLCGGEIYRGMNSEASGHWRRVSQEMFFSDLSARGRIVSTRELGVDEASRLPVPFSFETILHHKRIPFISYPFEWSFSMLRDAALLHLEILTAALPSGVILKDASPYNVQFQGSRPVFIDVGSFVVQRSGEPWVGYRQFCEMMLFPLMLQAYRQIDIQPILRVKLEGIPATQFMRSLSWFDLLRPGVFFHGWLQSLLEHPSAETSTNAIDDLKSSGFTNRMIENNLRRLLKLVARLTWNPEQTMWTNYRRFLPHVRQDLGAKADFIGMVCGQRRRKLVWDLGCNDGHFSRIAGEHADTVVAMDQDHGCVERLYRNLVQDGITNILPLCIDLLNPTPALGWRGKERRRLEDRGLPDLIFCLGLIHHLVIGGNIPLVEVADWLASLHGEVVLEFPDKQDPMVQQLLSNKRDQYDDYSFDRLEVALKGRFHVAARTQLPSGQRTLLHLIPTSTSNGAA